MSLVGPRPPLVTEVAEYDIWPRRRLSTKPGITGLWQVEARHEPEFDRWVERDLACIDAGRSRVEIDVIALEARSDEAAGANPTLLLIGEAKSGPDPRGTPDLHRLERARELLAGRARVERTRLAIFAAGGFTADLQAEATRRSDVVLVDLERLYAGD